MVQSKVKTPQERYAEALQRLATHLNYKGRLHQGRPTFRFNPAGQLKTITSKLHTPEYENLMLESMLAGKGKQMFNADKLAASALEHLSEFLPAKKFNNISGFILSLDDKGGFNSQIRYK